MPVLLNALAVATLLSGGQSRRGMKKVAFQIGSFREYAKLFLVCVKGFVLLRKYFKVHSQPASFLYPLRHLVISVNFKHRAISDARTRWVHNWHVVVVTTMLFNAMSVDTRGQ